MELIQESLVVRAIGPSDYARLADFLIEFGDKPLGYWMDRFDLWWDKNPAFNGNNERGWIIQDGEIFGGFIACIPSLLQLDGKQITAINISSWNVLPEYRSHSMELFFKASSGAKDTLIFDTTPSDEVVKVLKAFKYKAVLESGLNQSILPIKMDKLLWARLTSHPLVNRLLNPVFRSYTLKRITSGVSQKILFIAIKVSSICLQMMFSKRLKINNLEGYIVTRIDRSGQAIDDLWSRTKNRYFLTNIRNKEIIDWYCFASSYHRKDLFVCYRGKKCVGFIITRSFERQELKILECLDIWLDPEYEECLDVLIKEIKNYAEEKNLDVVQIPHYSKELGKKLSSMNMIDRVTMECRSFYKAPRAIAGQISALNTYFTRAQGDNGL